MVTCNGPYACLFPKPYTNTDDKNNNCQFSGASRCPHLLVQIRSLGLVEICGKNHGGIFERLGDWLQRTWGLVVHSTDIRPDIYVPCNPLQSPKLRLQVRPIDEWGRLCDRSFAAGPQQADGQVLGANRFLKTRGKDGESNMGKLTMALVSFMTNTCGWGLKFIDGCNLGRNGQIREMQMKFTAPHPLNLVAPHLMIDLRQAGYIEIYGPDTRGVYGFLHQWLEKNWNATVLPADFQFCDRKYRCRAFQKRGSEGENNMGLCAMHLVDFLSKGCHWKMIACNASNFGRLGDQREQQIVLRYDDFAHQDCDHLLVELRDVGYVEVSGIQNAPSAASAMHEFFSHQWRCSEYRNSIFEVFNAKYCDRKYRTPPNFYFRDGLRNNLGRRTLELATFMSSRGWELASCNGGSLTLPNQKKHGNGLVREHQIKFVGAKREGLSSCPLLMVEFRSVPARDVMGRASHESFIEITGANVNDVHGKLAGFVQSHMQSRLIATATPTCDLGFVCDAFQMKEAALDCKEGRFLGETNFGKYAMRLCDYMVDYLGEWDLLVCNNNCITVQLKGQTAVAREAMMVFRHRQSGRDVFLTDSQAVCLGRAPRAPPSYWSAAARSGKVPQEMVSATEEELAMLQEVMDGTYKAVATRDRGGKPIASRFVVVQALRSENPVLWDRYAGRREQVAVQLSSRGEDFPITPSTLSASLGLALRCLHEEHGNPSNEAYLLHGSNPTSALSILRTSFKMGLAGRNAGSMFGPGVYLAESSVKADEYAQDDTNGSYAGLYAVLFCRAVVGRALQVTDPADYGPLVTSGDFESVVGDRERAVGTFREFVFFHEEAIYPEFAVFYRREL
ncbi:Parp14 [Symbiodinium microadriaticum]|nr:Parp14 [Symbiodinium microadriaticum]